MTVTLIQKALEGIVLFTHDREKEYFWVKKLSEVIKEHADILNDQPDDPFWNFSENIKKLQEMHKKFTGDRFRQYLCDYPEIMLEPHSERIRKLQRIRKNNRQGHQVYEIPADDVIANAVQQFTIKYLRAPTLSDQDFVPSRHKNWEDLNKALLNCGRASYLEIWRQSPLSSQNKIKAINIRNIINTAKFIYDAGNFKEDGSLKTDTKFYISLKSDIAGFSKDQLVEIFSGEAILGTPIPDLQKAFKEGALIGIDHPLLELDQNNLPTTLEDFLVATNVVNDVSEIPMQLPFLKLDSSIPPNP